MCLNVWLDDGVCSACHQQQGHSRDDLMGCVLCAKRGPVIYSRFDLIELSMNTKQKCPWHVCLATKCVATDLDLCVS